MNSTELRIGNIIDMGREGIGMVSGYNLYQKSVQENGGSVSDYYNEWQPIPLNEEWLLKFGILEDNCYPHKFIDGLLKIRGGVYFYKYHNMDIEIPYVHTIQNIYFALTHEELTFKTN